MSIMILCFIFIVSTQNPKNVIVTARSFQIVTSVTVSKTTIKPKNIHKEIHAQGRN